MYIFFGFVSEVLISSLQTRPNNRKGYNTSHKSIAIHRLLLVIMKKLLFSKIDLRLNHTLLKLNK